MQVEIREPRVTAGHISGTTSQVLGKRLRWLLAGGALFAGLACSGGDAGVPSAQSVATVLATGLAPSAPPAEPGVAERYLAYWEARREANRLGDPAAASLAELATGRQLEQARDEVRTNRSLGLTYRTPDPSLTAHDIHVESRTRRRAVLSDCFVNDGIVIERRTGRVVDDTVVTRRISAVMRMVDGEWRLAATEVLQEWEGVSECAGSSGS
jgi:hypothetical protein